MDTTLMSDGVLEVGYVGSKGTKDAIANVLRAGSRAVDGKGELFNRAITSLGGHFWTVGAWHGVAAMAGALLVGALSISACLAWRTGRRHRAGGTAEPAPGGTAVRGG